MISSMKKTLYKILTDWPLPMISDRSLRVLLPQSSVSNRRSLVKRCFQDETLVPLKKGIYVLVALNHN
jgi:hypothetical protein